MRPVTRLALTVLALSLAPLPAADLAAEFVNPPDSAKPHTWWHWMNGNITAEGITLDLEAMQSAGVGGAQIFDVTDGIPAGPVKYGSDEWRRMIRHAITAADRLGIEVCFHNCAGWSSSGGPWVKPEQAQQILTSTELRVSGPKQFDDVVPQPPTRLDCYREVAVLAFRTPPAEAVGLAAAKPTVTSSVNGDPAVLIDGNAGTYLSLPFSRSQREPTVQLDFAEPFGARSLVLQTPSGRNGHRVTLEVSDDGQTWRTLRDFRIPSSHTGTSVASVQFEPLAAKHFRLTCRQGDRRSGRLALSELELSGGYRLDNWGGKAGYTRVDGLEPTRGVDLPADNVIAKDAILDLTSKIGADGKLTWNVPAGDWTIVRLGYTPTGKDNHPAPEEGRGLEVDKLSREAVDAFWQEGTINEVLSDNAKLVPKTLNNILIDSYEVGNMNWTPRMREEFTRRRGYDPYPYLPTVVGRVVGTVEESERFLWDFRKTIAELFEENYVGGFAELAHAKGLQLSIEPYGNGPFDDLSTGGRADIPMSEFWVGQAGSTHGAKLAGSIAHTYGRKYVGAESFTSNPENGGWRNHPSAIKALGDAWYCGGINRFIFHEYNLQPWTDRVPGMTMGPHGFHFNRLTTWWNQGSAWLRYLARCQYLLQSGRFVGDLVYWVGETSPVGLPGGNPKPPAGYDYDGCDTTILKQMTVTDGKLTLPSGMVYSVLVLPNRQTMTPAALQTVAALVKAGATVVGPKPTGSPSLADWPACDQQVQKLADQVWGDCDGQAVTRHAYGQGQVVWGEDLGELLHELGVEPDVLIDTGAMPFDTRWIHRKIDEADAIFVSSQLPREATAEISVRGTGRLPELWQPETGEMSPAPVWRVEEGRTIVPVTFSPAGSVFVVFRAQAPADHVVELQRDGEPLGAQQPDLTGRLEVRRAVYGVLESEEQGLVDVTAKLAAMVADGVLQVQASNSLAGDPAPNIVKQLRVRYVLNGQDGSATVEENRTLTIPADGTTGGKLVIRRSLYGDLPPETEEPKGDQTVDVTQVLRDRIQNGRLLAKAGNELAGDPAHLIVKQLEVEYAFDGEVRILRLPENATLILPTGDEPGLAAQSLLPARLDIVDGKPTLTAWKPGKYAARTAGGKTWSVDVSAPAEPVAVAGPWEVTFPPNLGAPPQATFDKLVSWTDRPEEGIKYFSGTATYRNAFDIHAELLGQGKAVYLDLGVVCELVTVKLNGQDLGVLWKPPFRLDVSALLKPRANRLELQVTNLWPNRLIGDEQLPDDRAWRGQALAGWPDWMTAGTPRPDTGRVTWTTWKHWTKGSPLLPSGLLGPVQLVPAVRETVGG